MSQYTIYQSVPESILDRNAKTYHQRKKLLFILMSKQDTFIKSVDLSIQSGYGTHGNSVQMRYDINDMQLEGIPILASREGFCYTRDLDKWSEYYDNIKKRIQGLQRKLDAINQIMAGLE